MAVRFTRSDLENFFLKEIDVDLFTTKILKQSDYQSLYKLYKQCAEFFRMVEGDVPTLDSTKESFNVLPENSSVDEKFLIALVDANDQIVSVVDLIQNYPEQDSWCLGLLVVDPNCRRQHIGTKFYKQIEAALASLGCQKISLVIQKQNNIAAQFWNANNYATYKESSQKLGSQINQILHLSKDLR